MKFFYAYGDFEFSFKLGEKLKQKIEDAIALRLQRIIGNARARNIVHYDSFIDALYGEDSLIKDTVAPIVHQ